MLPIIAISEQCSRLRCFLLRLTAATRYLVPLKTIAITGIEFCIRIDSFGMQKALPKPKLIISPLQKLTCMLLFMLLFPLLYVKIIPLNALDRLVQMSQSSFRGPLAQRLSTPKELHMPQSVTKKALIHVTMCSSSREYLILSGVRMAGRMFFQNGRIRL